MKNIFVLFLSVFLTYYSASSSTIHGILVIDTIDAAIKSGCQKDKENIKEYLKRMSISYSVKKPKISILEGTNFKKNKIIAFIKSLKTKSGDIVVFYFSGHGRWTKDEDFDLLLKDNDGLSFKEVRQLIESKNAQLKLIITDCCKRQDRGAVDKGEIPDLVIPIRDEKIDGNFKKLLSYQGSLIATSCKKYQESYTSNQGSYFTIAFLRAISYYVENQDPTWFGIAQQATSDTRKYAREKRRIQVPDINTSLLKFKVP